MGSILVALMQILLALLLFSHSSKANWYAPGSTRSLSGGYATGGSNTTIGDVVTLMRVGLVGGYAVRRLKMFNARVYLSRYRRSYWFGTRYHGLDNAYWLETREGCAYRMRDAERADLEYEERPEEPVLDIVFQCQKFAQYCCGLDCCDFYQ